MASYMRRLSAILFASILLSATIPRFLVNGDSSTASSSLSSSPSFTSISYPQATSISGEHGTYNFWNNCPVPIYYWVHPYPFLGSSLDQSNNGANHAEKYTEQSPIVSIGPGVKIHGLAYLGEVGGANLTLQLSQLNDPAKALKDNFTDVLAVTIPKTQEYMVSYAWDPNYRSMWEQLPPNLTPPTGTDTYFGPANCNLGGDAAHCAGLSHGTIRNTQTGSSSCGIFCDFWNYTCVDSPTFSWNKRVG